MFKLIVNDPIGAQLLIEIDKTGQYFDQERVVWDERVNGRLPKDIELGKMVRQDKKLLKLDDFLPEHKSYAEKIEQERIAESAERLQKEKLSEDIKNDELLLQIRSLDSTGIDEWFKANGKNKSEDLLKAIVKVLIEKEVLK